MIRKNYMMIPRHIAMLKREAERLQISMSELLRNIIDGYFKKQDSA